MGSIGPEKILMVLVVALIVLGPEKLPKMARQAGKAWSDFRRFREGLETEVRGAFGTDGDTPITSPVTSIRDTLRDTISSAGAPSGSSAGAGPGAPVPTDTPGREDVADQWSKDAPADPAGREAPAGPDPGPTVPGPAEPGSSSPALAPSAVDLPIPPDDPSLN